MQNSYDDVDPLGEVDPLFCAELPPAKKRKIPTNVIPEELRNSTINQVLGFVNNFWDCTANKTRAERADVIIKTKYETSMLVAKVKCLLCPMWISFPKSQFNSQILSYRSHVTKMHKLKENKSDHATDDTSREDKKVVQPKSKKTSAHQGKNVQVEEVFIACSSETNGQGGRGTSNTIEAASDNVEKLNLPTFAMEGVCRLCLEKAAVLTSVFQFKNVQTVAELINEIIPAISITESDTESKEICSSCLNIVLAANELKLASNESRKYIHEVTQRLPNEFCGVCLKIANNSNRLMTLWSELSLKSKILTLTIAPSIGELDPKYKDNAPHICGDCLKTVKEVSKLNSFCETRVTLHGQNMCEQRFNVPFICKYEDCKQRFSGGLAYQMHLSRKHNWKSKPEKFHKPKLNSIRKSSAPLPATKTIPSPNMASNPNPLKFTKSDAKLKLQQALQKVQPNLVNFVFEWNQSSLVRTRKRVEPNIGEIQHHLEKPTASVIKNSTPLERTRLQTPTEEPHWSEFNCLFPTCRSKGITVELKKESIDRHIAEYHNSYPRLVPRFNCRLCEHSATDENEFNLHFSVYHSVAAKIVANTKERCIKNITRSEKIKSISRTLLRRAPAVEKTNEMSSLIQSFELRSCSVLLRREDATKPNKEKSSPSENSLRSCSVLLRREDAIKPKKEKSSPTKNTLGTCSKLLRRVEAIKAMREKSSPTQNSFRSCSVFLKRVDAIEPVNERSSPVQRSLRSLGRSCKVGSARSFATEFMNARGNIKRVKVNTKGEMR